ncbi:hypothetical protein [Luteibaculum oceani]|uniref:T9SS type A sorting domain-containing protein n=1 Tax=Luteibaculum oceani TaxID=1294296 RepID=A0A5C6UYU2_9FLAO|nr:hypothetical protein [Luteibaculum oceani]TXC78653.1 hypothetical protein FRX97_08015 [Luteibaculum oceani]
MNQSFNLYLAILGWIIIGPSVFGQKSITTVGATHTEDFNGLPSSGSGDFSGLAEGWLIYNNSSEESSNISSDGSSTTTSYHSYGSTGDGDRSLGCIDDQFSNYVFGWLFENNTGKTLYKIYVSYQGEQWRVGATNGSQKIDFSYAIGNNITDLTSPSFSDINVLDFVSSVGCGTLSCNPRALDGNANATTETYLIQLPDGLADGEQIIFKWQYPNPNNNATSHGLAIDDIHITFFDEAFYLNTGETDITDEESWTPFSDGTPISETPTNNNFGEFVGDNQHFIIDRDVTLGSSTWSDLFIEGDNSYFIIDSGVTFTVQDDNINYSFELIVKENATWEVYVLDEDNFGPDTYDPADFPGVRFDSLYTGSTIIYKPTFSYNFDVPIANYYNVTFDTGDDFFEEDHEFTFAGSYKVRGSLTYNLAYDNTIFDSGNTPSILFTGGDTTTLNVPNHTGAGIFPGITIDAGNTFTLGNIQAQTGYSQFVHSNNFTNNGTVYIASNKALNMVGNLSNTGIFNVADDGAIVQATGSTLSNSGTFNITRNKPDGQASGLYNFWSTPVVSEQMSDIGASRQYELNAPGTSTSDWSWVSGSEYLTVGKGYALTGVNTHTFSGEINNGTITIATETNGTTGNYNALGNPYPSAINAADFLTENSAVLDGFINLFNHNPNYSYTEENQQITINNAGATVAGSTDNSQTLANTYIASGQGFYVCLTGTTSQTVSFKNSMRGGVNSEFKSGRANPILAKFHLQIIDQDKRYTTLFAIAENCTPLYDWGWDALGSDAGSFHIQTLNYEGHVLGIQTVGMVNPKVKIPLSIATPHTGNYQIHIEKSQFDKMGGLEPYLLDTETGESWNLWREDASIFFEDSHKSKNRFFLTFRRYTSPTTEIVSTNQIENSIKTWFHNGTLHFELSENSQPESVRLYSVDGKEILTKQISTTKFAIPVHNLSAEIILSSIQFKNGNQQNTTHYLNK